MAPTPQVKQENLNSLALKVKSNVAYLQKDDNVASALLIGLGALFLLSSFQFYPLPVILVLSIMCGLIALSMPPAVGRPVGVIAGVLFAMPAVAYQSPVFGWVFLLVMAATIFEAFGNWDVIAILEIIVLAPFAPFPFSILSGFTILVMALSALYFGSKKSMMVSVPAVMLVLLLSSLWAVQNSAFIPLHVGQYVREPLLSNDLKPEVPLSSLMPSVIDSLTSLLSSQNINSVTPALGKVVANLVTLFINDTAILNLLSWALILYMIGYLPGSTMLRKSKFKQIVASGMLLLVIVNNFIGFVAFGTSFDFLVFLYVGVSIAAIGSFDYFGMNLSGERTARRKERSKEFGRFGEKDMGDFSGTFDDIGGYEDVKDELKGAVITPLENKELAYQYGIKPAKGILFFGPPGTGKTMMMRALANEIDYHLEYVRTNDLLSEWYGESEKNLAEVFDNARRHAPCILFFDEIDSIAKKRDQYTSDDVAPRLMSLFLQELDGFSGRKDVIVIGATNIPNQLDPAVLRPGRFDKIIYMPLPDREARSAIFRVHLKKVPRSDDIDYEALGAKTERFSGADIKNVCTEAIGMAARDAAKSRSVVPISMKYMLAVLGAVKPSVSIESLEEFDKFKMDFERRSGKLEKKEEKKDDAIKWSDVVGLDSVRAALLEAIEIPLLHEDLMKQYKIKPSKGLLLFGPPGCGKTMIIRAAANELKATFLTISGAEITKTGFKSASGIIKETFNRAREQAPSIIFIDEIETLAPSREIGGGAGIIGQLLTELDGVKELKNVMLIGATNRPTILDSAILRPGRFDKIIYIPPPDMPARIKLFEINLQDAGIANLDLNQFAQETEGYTGADITSICQEVKMKLVRLQIKGMKGTAPMLTGADVLRVIKNRRPSVTPGMLEEFLQFLREYGERK